MPFPDFTPTVPELLHRSAARFGEHTFVVADDERLSYLDVGHALGGRRAGLLATGVGKGSRVGVLMPEQHRLRDRCARDHAHRRGARADQHVPAGARARLDHPPRRPHRAARAPAAS